MAFEQGAAGRAAPFALEAADFKQVGEIAVEAKVNANRHGLTAVVAYADALVRRSPPKKRRSDDVQRVLLQKKLLVAKDVRIGQIDRQDRVVVTDVGAEQQWLQFIDREFEAGQKPRVAVKEPIGPAFGRADV